MKNPLGTAAWSAILGIGLSFIAVVASDYAAGNKFLTGLLIVIFAATGVFSCVFLYGFVVLAKKFDAKLLKVMAWIGIGFFIAWALLILVSSFVSLASAQVEDLGGADAAAVLAFMLAFWVAFSLILGAYSILFGAGMLKLNGKVKYAKIAAILEIISGATMIIVIGFFVKMVAYIFEIIIMFKAAEKFEGSGRVKGKSRKT